MDKNSDDNTQEGVEKSEASSSSEELKTCTPCEPDSGWSNSSSSRGSNPFLTSSKNMFTLRTSVLGSTVQPGSNSGVAAPDSQSNKTFILNPPRLSNPFGKSAEEEKECDSNNKDKADDKSPSVPKISSTRNESSSSQVSFVPLGWNSSSPPGVSSSSVSTSQVSSSQAFGSSFIFGQNLREKVEGSKSSDSQTGVSSSDGHDHENNVEEPKSNGTTSEMLFSSAVKSEASDSKLADSSKTLSEAAREYEQARSVKRKFEPVLLITGEEHEQNVLQMNCKLFAYDKVSSGWQERGRGLLRLNDSTPAGSRLIIRAHGSLRVLINTKVWPGMVVQRASLKSLRITAMDNSETVKVFLISASQTEMNELQRYLETRVRKSEKSLDTTSKKLKPEDSS